MRRYAASAWCAAVDWLEPVGGWYDSSRERSVRSRIGSAAQLAWFRAHNNRVYNWLDESP